MGHQLGERSVDGGAAKISEDHAYGTPITWICGPLDQFALRESVNAVSHGATGYVRCIRECASSHFIGIARTAKCGEDVELPSIKPVGSEGLASCNGELLGQSSNAGKYLEGQEINVRTLAPPCGHDLIHLVRCF